MKKAKPSNAPWIIKPDYGQKNVYRLWNKDSNYHDDTSPEVMDANAQIMEAAQDTLEALKGLLNASPSPKKNIRKEFSYILHREAARKAIAKAEGKV